ncbi:hypothetical protein [Granulicella cerasi]|nr:hypothetical protein [Granulicella cerasi]
MLALAGCHAPSLPTPANEQSKAAEHALVDSQREQLASIPPPAKSRFMAIHSTEYWMNPTLTVQENMLELRVVLADPNPSSYGAGGMLRPVNARRQVLNISFDKLGDALAAIPQDAWPYGRVVAIEEAHKVPANAMPAIRRSVEKTVDKLTDLGVVAYDPADGNIR